MTARPDRRRFQWARAAGVVLGLVLIVASSSGMPPQESPAEADYGERLDFARVVINHSDYDGARALVDSLAAFARRTHSARWLSRCESALGYAFQVQAERESLTLSPRARDSLQVAAIAHYREALVQDPNWGPALNNLAQLYCALGRGDEAATLFHRALGLKNARYALYATNYADCAAQAGRWEDAERFLAEVIDSLPSDPSIESELWTLYRAHDPGAIPNHLWHLLRLRRYDTTELRALAVLESLEVGPMKQVEASTVLVLAMARHGYDQESFAESGAARALSRLAVREDTREMASELLLLFEAAAESRADFRWWTSRTETYVRSGREIRPLDAFQQLACSLGEQWESDDSLAVAERCYLLGAELDSTRVNPKAMLDLVNLYGRTGRPERIRALDERSRAGMSANRHGRALNARGWTELFDYHRSLALFYSAGAAGNRDSIQRAVDHLREAQEAAAEFNAIPVRRWTGRESLYVEPELVTRVTRRFTDAPDVVQSVRMNAARELIRQGRSVDAVRVLEPIDSLPTTARVSKQDSLTYVRLRRSVGMPASIRR